MVCLGGPEIKAAGAQNGPEVLWFHHQSWEDFVGSQSVGTFTTLFHLQIVHVDLQKAFAGQFLEIFKSLKNDSHIIHLQKIQSPSMVVYRASSKPSQLHHPLPPESPKSKRLGSDDAGGVVQDVVGIHVAGNGSPIENLLHHGILALNGAWVMQLDHCFLDHL